MEQPETTSIHWTEWNEEAFNLAEREGKPILLTLTATWCHWCHVMDQTSYSHPQVIELVNSRFIPIRVDVDRRPDISYRYNQGGFPSVAFLDAEAELITGRVYTPPQEMLPLLEQVSAQYPEVGAALRGRPGTTPSPSMGERRNGGEAPHPVLNRLQEIYDTDFGGFGLEPKQPPWESLKLLLALHSRSNVGATGQPPLLKMVSTTLEGIQSGLYDQKDQGFFRYSVSRDWRVPHYEKMLSNNANLSSVYLEAYQVTRRKRYKDVAVGALAYLLSTLHDPDRGLFYASQDAGEEYYRLPWKDREKAQNPPIDRTFYTGLNAVAASSLIKAYRVLGLPLYLQAAARVLDLLWQESWEPKRGLRHDIDQIPSYQRGTNAGFPLSQRGVRGEFHCFLSDHVFTAGAFLDLYQATGDYVGDQQQAPLGQAIALVQRIHELFGAPDGGFYDVAVPLSARDNSLAPLSQKEIPPNSPIPPLVRGGISLQRQKPVLENSLLAEVLLKLHYLTGEGQYLDLARTTLETFNGTVPGSSYLGPKGSRRMEEDEERLFLPAGSAWARAWDMLEAGPVHLVLLGSPTHQQTRSLWSAAMRAYMPHQILQPLDPEWDVDRIASSGFPLGREPALYACMGGMCLAPITTSEGVRALSAARPWATDR